MIFSTTPTIEGYEIAEYLRVIGGETISGIKFSKDFGAAFASFAGGRAAGYEEEAYKAREAALNDMWNRAVELGADAVVGISVDYSTIGQANDMLFVVATGTAVKLRAV
ncbi:YbjQ family protein [Corynebacterium sp.]|uniref:YbjQ family protein n=1 Tax=Corynebacterium sp. TaxID=1720 RepID=UPI0026DD7EC5|nr:YbjQ family protein [Corynebacterium sp.]MDO5032592.1 YbjQ family protein [Corynebacterium sp.]